MPLGKDLFKPADVPRLSFLNANFFGEEMAEFFGITCIVDLVIFSKAPLKFVKWHIDDLRSLNRCFFIFIETGRRVIPFICFRTHLIDLALPPK